MGTSYVQYPFKLQLTDVQWYLQMVFSFQSNPSLPCLQANLHRQLKHITMN